MGWVFSEGKLQVAAHFKDDSERDPAPREHPSGIDETGFVRREGGGARMTGGNAPRVSTCCSCMRFSKWTPPADLDALMTAAVVVRSSKARQMHPELKGLPPRALNCYFQSESESPARGITPPCDWLRQCLPFSSTPPPEAGLAGDIKYIQEQDRADCPGGKLTLAQAASAPLRRQWFQRIDALETGTPLFQPSRLAARELHRGSRPLPALTCKRRHTGKDSAAKEQRG
ncbi:hypothetical protein B0J15DRAFT_564336 [Fusarium solani]|uniref:Uncharacterized protein n=1 Tax=Fusarium solani TaxID=169388 RepID=A0A9P9K1I0_FUSSL|nr:uncharacterized protein B0J15DRAFT_564336 [Fusarium solani]KAH7244633.1 hypothetical protein B0J15DRAFT_564336 [Fusarium solani]